MYLICIFIRHKKAAQHYPTTQHTQKTKIKIKDIDYKKRVNAKAYKHKSADTNKTISQLNIQQLDVVNFIKSKAGKAKHLCSALHDIQTTLKRSGMDHTV